MQNSVDRTWRERGWPPELLAEARALRISDRVLQNALAWNAPLERFQDEVRWAGLLADGRMRFRQLTFADSEAFCELWANSPEDIGDWQVTVERGPNAFAQFELQERPVLQGLFDGQTMVACVSFSLRPTLVGGRRLWVRYGQAMRVHKDHRRHGYAHWVRSLPWAIGIGRPTRVQYDYIRSHNMAMEAWNRKRMPQVGSVPVREGDVPGFPVTVQQYPATPGDGGLKARPTATDGLKVRPTAVGLRRARAEDTERCAALINRTHAGRDLFRPYTAQSLYDRLDPDLASDGPVRWRPPYSLDDFYVLERAGQAVACAGLWDRGLDVRERWRHRETGAEREVSVTALLDFGFAEGHDGALAEIIEHLIGVTHELGRTFLVAPLETLPDVAALLTEQGPEPETRYLQWRTDEPALGVPPYVDLVYW